MKSLLNLAKIATSLITIQAVLSPVTTQAQNQSPNQGDAKPNFTDLSSSNARFWEANVAGGNYIVALDRISSISMHSYLLGGFIIHEVDIETHGAALARFYTIDTPASSGKNKVASRFTKRKDDILKRASNRSGFDVATTAEKTPQTTHAKTIEFNLASKRDLDLLYKSLKRSWTEGRGRKFSASKL